MNNMKPDFETVKVVVGWNCNLDCSYCCNKLPHVRDSFQPVEMEDLLQLNYRDWEITGGEITLPEYFPKVVRLCYRLSLKPIKPNIYVYTNGYILTEEQLSILCSVGVGGINIGLHKRYGWVEWNRWYHYNKLITLWIQDTEEDLLSSSNYYFSPLFKIRKWSLSECDNINTARFVLEN